MDMTKLAMAIQSLGEVLRERITELREKGEREGEMYRLAVHIFGQLAALVNVMMAEGEIDPETGEKVKEAMLPELRELRKASK